MTLIFAAIFSILLWASLLSSLWLAFTALAYMED